MGSDSLKQTVICGVDEVGRGCLAGAVVAAAVILGGETIEGLRDSKQLSAAKREQLDDEIRERCLAFAIGTASVEEIDRYNIRHATEFAMQRAVSGIVICPDKVLVDGNHAPTFPYPAEAIVGGDNKVAEIMAASIIAKVYRDKTMQELDAEFPAYGFAAHKGYPTSEHVRALQQHGVTAHHRRSFAPVKALLDESNESDEVDAPPLAAASS